MEKTTGKSIRIYLKDGTVSGIKIAEVVNQTIQATACPRSKVAELLSEEDIQMPGVYFLFGYEEETNFPKVYIGESEQIAKRIEEHVRSKDFWNELVIFNAKDENLGKSQVKYLESRCQQIAAGNHIYRMDNQNQSQLSQLPRAERDAMEEYLYYMKLLLGVLGYRLLEDVSRMPHIFYHGDPNSDSPKAEEPETTYNQYLVRESEELSVQRLYLNLSAGLTAEAYIDGDGIVVLKGSEAALQTHTGLSAGYANLRQQLIGNGVLALEGERYVFQSNYLFYTPSPAASVIAGYNLNGRQYWKNKSGQSLRVMEEEMFR